MPLFPFPTACKTYNVTTNPPFPLFHRFLYLFNKAIHYIFLSPLPSHLKTLHIRLTRHKLPINILCRPGNLVVHLSSSFYFYLSYPLRIILLSINLLNFFFPIFINRVLCISTYIYGYLWIFFEKGGRGGLANPDSLLIGFLVVSPFL